MGRSRNIQYADVAKVAASQVANGAKPTNASIADVLGGSFSTIAPLFKRWKVEQTGAAAPGELSAEFSLMLRFEIDRQIKIAVEALSAQLAEASETVDEVISENKAAAEDLALISEQLAEARKTVHTNTGTITELRAQVDVEKTRAEAAELSMKETEIALARSEGYCKALESARSETITRTPKKGRVRAVKAL